VVEERERAKAGVVILADAGVVEELKQAKAGVVEERGQAEEVSASAFAVVEEARCALRAVQSGAADGAAV
jgi:hypothetical protein